MAAASVASAQTATAPNDAAVDHYEFTLKPTVWVPRLGGTVSFGRSPIGGDINLEEGLNVDASETMFVPELALRKNSLWQLEFSAFDFSTTESAVFEGLEDFGQVELDPGDPYRTWFDMTSASVEFTYWGLQPRRFGRARTHRAGAVDLRFAPGVGVRFIDLEQRVEVFGEATDGVEATWLAPYLAAHMQMRYRLPQEFPVFDAFELDASLGVGPALGGDGGTMAQIRIGINALANHNVGVTFGYRLLQLNVKRDDYELEAGLQGLFAGLTVRF